MPIRAFFTDNICECDGYTSSVYGPELKDAADILVYPNPVEDILSLELESNSQKELSLSIIDMNGKVVMMSKSFHTKAVDVSELVDGFYFARIKVQDGAIWTISFVKL